METRSIIAEVTGGNVLRAYVNIHILYDDEDVRCPIRDPKGKTPFYFLDGARHDLKENGIKELRKAIREVT